MIRPALAAVVALALLGACAGPAERSTGPAPSTPAPSTPAPSTSASSTPTPARSEALAARPGAAAAVPAPVSVPAPVPARPEPEPVAPPEPPLTAERLRGMTGPEVIEALGPPRHRRSEPPAELWQFAGADCVVLAFLYPGARGVLTVTHVEYAGRTADGRTAVTSVDCLGGIRATAAVRARR
jgi:hypothetical protein